MFCCKGAKGYQGLQRAAAGKKQKKNEKMKKKKDKLKSNKQSSEDDDDWMDGKRKIICRKSSSMGYANGRKTRMGLSSAVSCAKSTFSYNLHVKIYENWSFCSWFFCCCCGFFFAFVGSSS